jgi:hypothetical protein
MILLGSRTQQPTESTQSTPPAQRQPSESGSGKRHLVLQA